LTLRYFKYYAGCSNNEGNTVIHKRKAGKTLVVRRWLATGLIVIGVIAAVVFITRPAPQHCVSPAQETVEIQTAPAPMRCFDNPADAIFYATDGAVVVPRDATNEEVAQILQAYYDGLER
jgi:hypothetical protein